jgi:hypothetical protein
MAGFSSMEAANDHGVIAEILQEGIAQPALLAASPPKHAGRAFRAQVAASS